MNNNPVAIFAWCIKCKCIETISCRKSFKYDDDDIPIFVATSCIHCVEAGDDLEYNITNKYSISIIQSDDNYKLLSQRYRRDLPILSNATFALWKPIEQLENILAKDQELGHFFICEIHN